MIPNKDKDSFARYVTDRFSPTFEYDRKEDEISARDFRINKPSGDIDQRYESWKSYEKSSQYSNVRKAEGLLPCDFSTSAEHLSSTLQSIGLSKSECEETMRGLANDKNVIMSRNDYTKQISLRRKPT